jgi:hypothetical protein
VRASRNDTLSYETEISSITAALLDALCFSFMSAMSLAIFSNALITSLSSGLRLARGGKCLSSTTMASQRRSALGQIRK